MDESHIYVRALALGCFYSHTGTRTFRTAGQLRGDRECPFSGVTKSGRVWRKVPESDARSVGLASTQLAQTDNASEVVRAEVGDSSECSDDATDTT